jgi:hypothetical protein
MDTSILSYLTLGAVVLSGIGAILGGVSVVLHAFASRTKTTVADRLAADVDLAHTRIDQVVSLLRGIAPASSAPTTPPSASSAPSSAAKAGTVATVALLAAVIGGVALVPACHTLGPASASGAVAFLDCEAADIKAQDLIDATKLADATVEHWLAGGAAASTTAIAADLAPFRSDLSKCALAGALALATGALAPGSNSTPGTATQGLTAAAAIAPPDPGQVRAAFAAAARAEGWPLIQVAKVAGGARL